MSLLQPLFSKTSETNIRDNCCGCISRMILKSKDRVPLDQVLPILLNNLPLTQDYEENEPIFKCIISLLQQNEPFVRFFLIFSYVLKSLD
jgi:hypothetical protein